MLKEGGGRFGAAILATPFWRRRFGAGHFGAENGRRILWRRRLAPDTLAPMMGAGHFSAEDGAAYYIVYFSCMENIFVWNIWLSRALNPFLG